MSLLFWKKNFLIPHLWSCKELLISETFQSWTKKKSRKTHHSLISHKKNRCCTKFSSTIVLCDFHFKIRLLRNRERERKRIRIYVLLRPVYWEGKKTELIECSPLFEMFQSYFSNDLFQIIYSCKVTGYYI